MRAGGCSSRRTAFGTVWPSGLRRWLQAPVRKGVGSNPTAVTFERSRAFFSQGARHARASCVVPRRSYASLALRRRGRRSAVAARCMAVRTFGAAVRSTGGFVQRTAFVIVWPSGLKRWLKVPVCKRVGSNPTAAICRNMLEMLRSCWHHGRSAYPSRSRPASSQLRRSSSCCDGFVCHRGGSRRRQ